MQLVLSIHSDGNATREETGPQKPPTAPEGSWILSFCKDCYYYYYCLFFIVVIIIFIVVIRISIRGCFRCCLWTNGFMRVVIKLSY